MKSGLTALFLFLGVLTSCSITHHMGGRYDFIGNWTITDFTSGEVLDESLRANYEKVKKQMLKDACMKFNSNHQFEMFLMGQHMKGTWEYKNEILTTTAEGKTESDIFTLEFDGKDVMRLSSSTGEEHFVLTLSRDK